MKLLVLSLVLLFSMPLNAQTNEIYSTVSQPRTRILYYNVPNMLEYITTKSYDTTWLEITDGYFEPKQVFSGIVVPTEIKNRKVSVSIIGVSGKDTILDSRFDFIQRVVPDPIITLGYNRINLAGDLNKLSDTAMFENLSFLPRFDPITELYMPFGSYFKISQFKVQIGKVEITVSGSNAGESVYQRIISSAKGTQIKFTEFSVIYTDGRSKIFSPMLAYIKKTDKDVPIPRKVFSESPD